MWLAEDNANSNHDDPGSPPLEGGEALCELFVEPHHHSTVEKSEVNLFNNLASFLEENNADRLNDVFPVIQEALPMAQPEVQLAASNSFLTILEKELVPHTTFTKTFLQSIMASVDSRDPVVANAWVETLLDVIDLLPKEVVKQNILSLAVAKGQMSQPVTSRLSCCRMLGKICAKFEPYLIKKEILPVVQSLCQDVDYEVRGCMCRQLDSVARGLGLEATKSAIFPELVELANDEESYVRLAGIETVVNMLSLLDDETCTQTIVPLVKNFCENCIKSQDVTLPIVAKQLGKLCHGLSVNLTIEQNAWFLEFYRQVAKLGLPQHREDDDDDDDCSDNVQAPMPDIVPRLDDQDKYTECRYCCAYNFPAMVLFAGPNDFKGQLYDTFYDLVRDPHVKVRRTIACGFHEIAKLLGPCVYCVQGELISLLRDDSLEVLKGLIPNLPITLEALAKEGTMGNEFKLYDSDDVMAAVVRCEEVISRTSNWRLSAEFLDKLSCLPKCLSSNTIFHKFTPLVFRKLFTARPIPCRVAAASTFLVFLRSNPRQDHRQEICYRLIEELCHGYSCHNRMLFITVCDLIIDIISKSFFKDNFFVPLLGLASDPVPNVRLRLCSIFPRMKSTLKFPNDRNLLQELETCVGKLMIDEEDRDVSAAVRRAILELDKIEVPVNAVMTRRNPSEDADDQQREEEERFLMAKEAEEKTSPIPVTKSPEKKPLWKQGAGKIPIRRSLGGSPEMRRSSTIGSSLVALHLSSAPLNERAANGGSGSGLSRIPTLQTSKTQGSDRSRAATKNTTSEQLRKLMTSPPRPAFRPTVPPRSSIGSPVPSPEAIRRVVQARSASASPSLSAFRRKSVGPGTIISSVTSSLRSPRPTTSVPLSKPSSSSQSHIPRYSSSSPVPPDNAPSLDHLFPSRLHLLSLASSSSPTNISNLPTPDDYELELLDLVDEGEESPCCVSPQPDIMLALAQRNAIIAKSGEGGPSRLPGPVHRGNNSRGGGGKMFAHWSRSHLNRCTTPPVTERVGRPLVDGGRVCRSASSSPTYALRSFIPRYVGSPASTPQSPTQQHSSLDSPTIAAFNRTNSSIQIAPHKAVFSAVSDCGRAGGAHKGASLPGTPRSMSPTHCLSIAQSHIQCQHRPTKGIPSPQNILGSPRPPRRASSASQQDVCTSRSVRSLVRELESLSTVTTANSESGECHQRVSNKYSRDDNSKPLSK